MAHFETQCSISHACDIFTPLRKTAWHAYPVFASRRRLAFLTNFSTFFSDYDLPEVDRRIAGTPNEFIESPMSDGTIEEDFEKALAKEVQGSDRRPSEASGNLTLEGTSMSDEDFSDIARYGFVEVVGDDVKGCKIIVFSACRLPPNKNFDYAR